MHTTLVEYLNQRKSLKTFFNGGIALDCLINNYENVRMCTRDTENIKNLVIIFPFDQITF